MSHLGQNEAPQHDYNVPQLQPLTAIIRQGIQDIGDTLRRGRRKVYSYIPILSIFLVNYNKLLVLYFIAHY